MTQEMREAKVREIVSQLTVAEKLSLCAETGYRRFGILKRFGIDGIADSDSSVFEASEHENQNVAAEDLQGFTGTAFPTLGLLAATWDRSYTKEIGRLFALDCKQGGIDMLCRPGINIKRSPLSGRNFEFFLRGPGPGRRVGRRHDPRHSEHPYRRQRKALRRQRPGV